MRYSNIETFYASVLAPTMAIIACGVLVALSSMGSKPDQSSCDEDFVLKFADGRKAIFETDGEIHLVTVGSSLSSAGNVTAIEKQDGHWTVTTSKHLRFVQNAG